MYVAHCPSPGPVYRLNQTWDSISGKRKEQWLNLKKIFQTKENRKYAAQEQFWSAVTSTLTLIVSCLHRAYRDRLRTVGGPVNPAFSFYLTVHMNGFCIRSTKQIVMLILRNMAGFDFH